MVGVITAVSRNATHEFSKPVREAIRLLAGLGVEGDAHAGVTVRHRSRVAVDPTQPNLRQVHLIHAELFGELAALGFAVRPGLMGENITTEGLDLLALPKGAVLRIGAEAAVEITGLRNPCYQLDQLQAGLMAASLERRGDHLIRKAGVMSVVLQGGDVRAGDEIVVEYPAGRPVPLEPV